MDRKFEASEEGVIEMFDFFVKELEYIGIEEYKVNSEISPSTIFLAGAPGAGKSEFIDTIKYNSKFIVIDVDKYRVLFEGYEGYNASIFQNFSTKVANKLYKYCMHNNLNVIVDGTFGNLNIIEQNINQCIKNNREFGVVLIYQDPVISYFYTKLRQLEGKRNVPQNVFIDKFYNSIQNAFEVKQKYKDMFFIFAYKNAKGIFQTNKNVVDKKSFDKKVMLNYNQNLLIDNLNYIDDLFEKSSKISSKIISFLNPIFDLFNLITRGLGLRKKEKKKRSNSGN
ncbi:MAG: zeta toxin family protein [Candidatus Gracilibacteria bacterium]|nr:zeta toxin family protein [Candidatus Gracilibacteria bacterium]